MCWFNWLTGCFYHLMIGVMNYCVIDNTNLPTWCYQIFHHKCIMFLKKIEVQEKCKKNYWTKGYLISRIVAVKNLGYRKTENIWDKRVFDNIKRICSWFFVMRFSLYRNLYSGRRCRSGVLAERQRALQILWCSPEQIGLPANPTMIPVPPFSTLATSFLLLPIGYNEEWGTSKIGSQLEHVPE